MRRIIWVHVVQACDKLSSCLLATARTVIYVNVLKFWTLSSILFMLKFCLLCICLLKCLVEWQTVKTAPDLGLHCLYMAFCQERWCSKIKDIYLTYNWMTNCDLLLNVLELFYFESNTLKIDKNAVDSFLFFPTVRHCSTKPLPASLAVTNALTSIYDVSDAKNDVAQSNVQETANNVKKSQNPVICCRIKYSSFPFLFRRAEFDKE